VSLKGEQAVDDVKAEAERKAAEGKRAGKHAANAAARSAEQGKEEDKGISNLFLKVKQAVDEKVEDKGVFGGGSTYFTIVMHYFLTS
jgi:hypothetical protein